MKATSSDSPEGLLAAAGFFGFSLFFLIFGCVLVWFSCLRETREFWFNSGGYPILLRDIVRVFYYPLLAFCLLGTLGLTTALCAKIRMPLSSVCFQIGMITLCWVLITASVMISVTNNVDNLWNGHSLHYKPPLINR